MNLDRQIAKLQTIFGVSKLELSVVALILFALTLGQIVNIQDIRETEQIAQELASYDNIVETSFVGIDNEGSKNEELALADTLQHKKKKFPEKAPKEKIVGKININTASKVELMKLKGIGVKTAEKIIDYRKKNTFKSIEEIQKVKGIGPKKFEAMKEHITV